jgi:hypothetical protein
MNRITGHSDDIIAIQGLMNEELNPSGDTGFLALSDGTLLNFEYDSDGIWRFRPMFKGELYDSKVDGTVEDDTNDIINLKAAPKWVLIGTQVAR